MSNYIVSEIDMEAPVKVTIHHDPDNLNTHEWPEGVTLHRPVDTHRDALDYTRSGSFWEFAADHIVKPANTTAFFTHEDDHGIALADSYPEANGIIFIPSGGHENPYTNPRKAAAAILNEFTQMVNGETYGLVATLRNGSEESVWGFVGLEHAQDAAVEYYGIEADDEVKYN